jgi:hypothetical protein
MSSEISTEASASTFRPWHFFVLAGLAAATATVLLLRSQDPSHVFFISLAIIAASLVGLAAHRMLRPLVSADEAESIDMLGGRTRAAMEREKLLVLRSIKELEFDRAMGKLSDSDFADMSARLRSRAARLIRQLDQGASGYRELIERELARRLGHAGAPSAGAEVTEALPGDLVKAPREVRALECPSCSALNDLDARFCKRCGERFPETT